MEALSEISSLVKEYISPEVIWLVPCLICSWLDCKEIKEN
mgnify:CR=1 FL=1